MIKKSNLEGPKKKVANKLRQIISEVKAILLMMIGYMRNKKTKALLNRLLFP